MEMAKMEEIFQTICKANDNEIATGEHIITTVYFIGDTIRPLVLTEINKVNGKHYHQAVREAAIKSGQSYIVVVNTIAQHGGVTGDCIMRTLYAPTKKVVNLAWYSDGKILDTATIKGRHHTMDIQDPWDAWSMIELEVE